jgi:hypothetical protein
MADAKVARLAGDSVLDSLGILQGTDKSSLAWDYLRHFEREFSQFRDQSINLIEIGVAGGSSLRAWTQFFTLARIVGVDINPNCKHFANDRVSIEIGSQADPEFLTSLCEKYPPSIVIDDGSHQADHIRFTFEHVFPLLADGGCYVVEDLHFHFSEGHAKAWRGSATVSPQDYLSSIGNKVLAAEFGANLSMFAPASILATVDRVTFLPRAVVIWKLAAVDFEQRLARWETLAQKSGIAENWSRVARQALQSGGPLDRAEHAARKAVEIDAGNWNHHQILSRVLEASKDFLGAYRATENALARCPAASDSRRGLTTRLEKLRQQLS